MTREKRKQLEKRVYETYPESKEEQTCAATKRRMDHKRGELRKRLIREEQAGHQSKKEYE